jgi:heat shock protein 4
LGARKIDYMLFEIFATEFVKKFGCDPRDDKRARLRMLDAIEKMRKLLTANKEAEINCESLMEE